MPSVQRLVTKTMSHKHYLQAGLWRKIVWWSVVQIILRHQLCKQFLLRYILLGATLFFYCSNFPLYLVHYQIIDLVWRWGGIDKLMGKEMNGPFCRSISVTRFFGVVYEKYWIVSPEICSTFIQFIVIKQLFGNLDNGLVWAVVIHKFCQQIRIVSSSWTTWVGATWCHQTLQKWGFYGKIFSILWLMKNRFMGPFSRLVLDSFVAPHILDREINRKASNWLGFRIKLFFKNRCLILSSF